MSVNASDLPVAVDAEGYLKDLDDWTEAVAELIAVQENIDLTEEHWQVIHLLREFYREFGISPAMRILVKQVRIKLGTDKGSSIFLMKLFPGSPAKIASKIAGLPKPTNCL
ncbi:MAG: TusE/DsrC/DsvC family sulfur relay protein [Motiliproteus sp.]|nr:TusE/DsrC/DsvC family sulfur relay protein [Motiliproteus sp.]MCW9053911.1 TusE/DsrC/DsvC family sulfur relay protein [Motiliproteus sp.]